MHYYTVEGLDDFSDVLCRVQGELKRELKRERDVVIFWSNPKFVGRWAALRRCSALAGGRAGKTIDDSFDPARRQQVSDVVSLGLAR
jgi:hypothetical protein